MHARISVPSLLLFALFGADAHGHATLNHASPPVGGTVGPRHVKSRCRSSKTSNRLSVQYK